jgi:hypothetical protein
MATEILQQAAQLNKMELDQLRKDGVADPGRED